MNKTAVVAVIALAVASCTQEKTTQQSVQLSPSIATTVSASNPTPQVTSNPQPSSMKSSLPVLNTNIKHTPTSSTIHKHTSTLRQFTLINGKPKIIANKPTTQLNPDAPIRTPVSGNCPCPYDTDKIGKSCGERSAYSKPGGEHPVCYVKDRH